MSKKYEDLPVKKNDRLEVTIVDLTHDGRGVAKVEGYPLFVDGALPGETVMVHVLKVLKKYGYAKVNRWITKSEDRVEDVEDDLIRTGIAPLHHMAYPAQLLFKQGQVQASMERIGKFSDMTVHPVIGMDKPFGYRNKAQIPVRAIKGELELGFFRRNSHDLIPVEDFYIQDKEIDQILLSLKALMRRFEVPAYNEENHTGSLKNIIVRKGFYSGEIMLVFVTRKKKFFNLDFMVKDIVKDYPNIVSVYHSSQPEVSNRILGETLTLVYGKETIKDKMLGNSYQISPNSFYQINTEQAEVLYKKAIELAELKETDVVLDAYCGIGTIALSMAPYVDHVYGVEMIEEAIEDAKRNAKANGISNVTFKTGLADKVLDVWKENETHFDVIVVDPPRKGLEGTFIDSCAALNPGKIIYVSCDSGTLARDLKAFAEHGYTTKDIYPIDMFPQTSHIECVTVLTK